MYGRHQRKKFKRRTIHHDLKCHHAKYGKKLSFRFNLTDVEESRVCQDTDECKAEDIRCSHSCKNDIGGYLCTCPPGYQIGDDQETCEDVDECLSLSSSCNLHEKCVNTPGSFTCQYSCDVGFSITSSGTACEDIDECQVDEPCQQECQNLVGSYRCLCYRGYILRIDGHCADVNECEIYKTPCSYQCTNTPGSFKCSCPDGYQLLNNGRCKDIDECGTFRHNCSKKEICQNFEGGFKCISDCPTGLIMNTNGSCLDINECDRRSSVTCHYTQRCENLWGSYRCTCRRGYKSIGPGHPCIDINECQNSAPPCNFKCRNLMGDYECICPNGMRRLRDKKTCLALQYDDKYRPRHYEDRRQLPPRRYKTREYVEQRKLKRVYRLTDCPKGFTSKDEDCKDINECSKPGRCEHACENTHGSFYCTCPPGYKLMEDQHNCQDIDECFDSEVSCSEDQICVNLKGSFKCEDFLCPYGYVKGPNQGFCGMDCRELYGKCPSAVQRNHYIIYLWNSVPAGTLAFQDLMKLSPVDRKGNPVPHSEFSMKSQKLEAEFGVRQETGIGILSTLKSLNPGEDYRIIVEANSYDADRRIVKYATRFVIVLHVSEYPY